MLRDGKPGLAPKAFGAALQPRLSLGMTANLLRLRDDSKIWLGRFPAFRITLLRLFVRYGARNDHIFSWLPIDRRCYLMLGRQLQRIDHAQHFVEVAPRRHRIDKDKLDLLVWPDDENVSNRRVIGWLARFGVACGIGRKHPVEFRDLEVRIADDWIVRRMTLSLFDVLRPSLMISGRIDRQSHDLHISALKLRFDLGHVTKLGRTDGCEVLRVRKQNGPRIADPIMEPIRPSLVSASKSGAVSPIFICFSSSVLCVVGLSVFQIAEQKSIFFGRISQRPYDAINSQNF